MEKRIIDKWANNLTKLFTPYGTYEEELILAIVQTGKTIAIETFELTRENNAESILKMFNDTKSSFESSTGTKINGDIDFYFGYCKVVGENIASGTPEKIEKILDETVRIFT